MIVLGFDTSTSATVAALRTADARTVLARDDPPAGAHPGHATRLLEMVHDLLMQAGVAWSDIDRIAVGVGPGTFTGLRVGVATARGLAQSLGAELVAVSSLKALAAAALADGPAGAEPTAVLAVIDARRGEAFAAAYDAAAPGEDPRELAQARAVPPQGLAEVIATAERALDGARRSWLAVGDGAIRFRDAPALAAVRIPPDGSPLHLISGVTVCELGSRATPVDALEIEPDYRRRPDAELALERAGAAAGVAP